MRSRMKDIEGKPVRSEAYKAADIKLQRFYGKSLEELQDFLTEKTTLHVYVGYDYISLSKDGSNDDVLSINFCPEESKKVGLFELVFNYHEYSKEGLDFLEKNFLDPLAPTQVELDLYELEMGYKYPLMRYFKAPQEDYKVPQEDFLEPAGELL